MLMNLLRGVSIVLLGILAYNDNIKVWMVFVAGIILSVCVAIFSPGINSSIPDLVPKSKITNANFLFAIVTNGASMLGNIAGGFLFQIIGAPLMFLFNGLSFLFSGFSILLVKIPEIEKKIDQHFLDDLKDGFDFVWRLKGLRYTLLVAAFSNFFANIAMILLLPMFQKTPDLGPGKYGIAMGCFMGGAFVGFIFTSIITSSYGPVLRTILPSIAHGDVLVEATSLSSFISNISRLLGPVIGVMLFGFYGIFIILLINSFSYIFASIFEMFINVPKGNKRPEKVNFHAFKNHFIGGIKFIMGEKFILTVVIVVVIVNFTLAPLTIGLVYISKTILKVSDFQYGLLEGCFAVSMMVAPMVIGSILKKIRTGIIMFLSIFAVAILIITKGRFSAMQKNLF